MTERDTILYRTLAPLGHPAYRVGNDGSVWTRLRRVSLGIGRGSTFVPGDTWKRLAASPCKSTGYPRVTLAGETGRKNWFVHQLVALTFLGPYPDGMEVAHDNGNPRDNRVCNLLYKTPVANQQDRVRHGTHSRGERNKRSKLSDSQAAAMRADYAAGMRNKAELGRKYGVSRSCASLIVLGKSRTHA